MLYGNLVTDELVAAAFQSNTDDAEDQRSGKRDRVPIDDRMCPAGRQGQVLAAPKRKQCRYDQALKAEHKKELAAAPTLIQSFYLIWRQVAFFDGQQCVRHCVLGLRVFLV
jgi:hypothetical protein